jgi:hypothetical protein
MQQAHAAGTCSRHMQQAHAAGTCSRHMQQEYAAWNSSIDIQYGPTAWTCRFHFKDRQLGHIMQHDMGMKHGHTIQHGDAARTCSMEIQH